MNPASARRKQVPRPRYAVVDTTFAVVDMGAVAVARLMQEGVPASLIEHRTVPGFKDLGVACKQLLEGRDAAGRPDTEPCDIAIACAMVGPEPIDKQCAQDASFGLQMCQQATAKHVLEVFVHMDETDDPKELIAVTENRVAEHATNAFWLLEAPQELRRRAGTGQRQGFPDVGPLGARPGTEPLIGGGTRYTTGMRHGP